LFNLPAKALLLIVATAILLVTFRKRDFSEKPGFFLVLQRYFTGLPFRKSCSRRL